MVGAGDMAEQTRQAIRNMRTVLEAAGGTLEDIVSIIVLHDRHARVQRYRRARAWSSSRTKLPTSTIVEVNHLADPAC